MGNISSSAGNVNQTTRLSYTSGNISDSRTITKTHSASNVFSRTTNLDNTRNSLNTEVQYNNRNDFTSNNKYNSVNNRQTNDNREQSDSSNKKNKGGVLCERNNIRRGSSVENVNTTGLDVANGNLKKLKYDAEVEVNAL